MNRGVVALAGLIVCAAPQLEASVEGLQFEPNRGQSGADVRFLSRARNLSVFLTDSRIFCGDGNGSIALAFDGSDPTSRWVPLETIQGSTSYLVGNDPSKWLRDVPHFARLSRRQLYSGIDLILYGGQNGLEYDFVLAAGARPETIRIQIDSPGALRIDRHGDLVLQIGSERIIQRKPRLYQTDSSGARHAIRGAYRLLSRNVIGFTTGAYDHRRPLTIDPVLESATWLGGSGDDRVVSARSDFAIVGTTTSADFPGVTSAQHRGSDIFIYVPDTRSTYIVGGSGDDIVTSVVMGPTLGPGGGMLLGGYTNSRDLPTPDYTGSRIQAAPYGGGDWDGFLLYLSAPFSNPVFRYIGGSGDDRVLSVGILPNSAFYLTGTTTSADFPSVNAWQPTLAGGVDSFIAVRTLDSFLFSTYAGGSGDDRASAMIIGANGDFYVAGETSSNDWTVPVPWTGARNGPSDGFLLHVTNAYQVDSAILFGGSGSDSVTAVTRGSAGNITVAGTTGSTDFATTDATTFAGGASDAFVQQFSADLKTTRFATLLGGSGADEPAALATNKFNELFLAGSTSSADFPTRDAIQIGYGGGGSDGFFAHFDPAGKLISSSYCGGSGADRINAVTFTDSGHLFLGGNSDSPDLRLKNPNQTTNAGGIDGFYADVTIARIYTSALTVGKDLGAAGYALLGDPRNTKGVPLTIASSDPSSVLVAARPDDAGSASITVANRATDTDLAGRAYYAFCLVNSGSSTLTLSAPGYPDANTTVNCVSSAIVISPTNTTVSLDGSVPSQAYVTLAAIDASGQAIAFESPRGGMAPVQISAVSSDPNIVQPAKSPSTVDWFTTPAPYALRGANPGSATIEFSTNSPFPFSPSNQLTVRVTSGSLTLSLPRLARDFVGYLGISSGYAQLPASAIVTITSSDPSKVRITNSLLLPGIASVTVPAASLNTTPLFLEALDTSGPVSITASAPGFDSVTAPVRFGVSRLALIDNANQPVTQIALSPGDTAQPILMLYVDVGTGPPPYYFPDHIRAGAAPVLAQLASADGKIVIPFGFFTNGYLSTSAFISSPGVFTTSLLPGSGLVDKLPPPLTVTLAPAIQLNVNSVTIGKNLESSAYLTRAPSGGLVTYSSSDPSKLVVSGDSAVAGQAKVTTNSGVSLQALADSGDVQVTASSTVGVSTTLTVHLTPSGFGWNTQTAAAYDSVSVVPYMLDPITLAAVSPQPLRAGITGVVTLQNSNPSVVSLDSSQISLAASLAVKMSAIGAGQATIGIVQPPGFVAPAGRGPLFVTATMPAFTLGPVKIGKNLQLPLNLAIPTLPAAAAITLISGDPSRLRLSTSQTDLGAGSLTLHRVSGNYAQVYLQAIDGPADVSLTVSAPGFDDASTLVQIVPTAIAFWSNGNSGDPLYSTGQGQAPLSVSLRAVLDNGPAFDPYTLFTLRPGLDPVPIQITSSDPTVAAADLAVFNASTNQAQVGVKPLLPGQANLTITTPPGFVAARPGYGRNATIVVKAPAFTFADVILGKDLQTSVTLAIVNGNTVLASDVDVTLASSDPSKLLLSADAATTGTASITVHFAATQNGIRSIFLQGLASSGTVTVQSSAPGYLTATSNITLTPTTFFSNDRFLNLTDVNPAVHLTAAALVSGSPYSPYPPFQVRPGLGSVPVTVSSSNSSVLAVPQAFTLNRSATTTEIPVMLIAPGTVTLSFSAPDGYTIPPVSLTVQGGTITRYYSSSALGKDLQTTLGISLVPNVSVTVTSEDPSRVLLSLSANSLGQTSVTFTSQNNTTTIYVQSLADNGTVNVDITAPGYQTLATPFNLSPPEVLLISPRIPSLTPQSPPLAFSAMLSATASATGETLRPGAAPITVNVTLSDPTIGKLTPSQLIFNPGDSTENFSFQPTAAGSALLSLTVPAGFTDPFSGRQQFITVIPVH